MPIKLPCDERAANELSASFLQKSQGDIANLVAALENSSRFSFAESFGRYDHLRAAAMEAMHLFMLLELTHPDAAMREAGRKKTSEFRQHFREHLDGNERLYKGLKVVADHLLVGDDITAAERYYMEESMTWFRRKGMALDGKAKVRFRELSKRIDQLAADFDKNLQDDVRPLILRHDELAGVNSTFLEQLKRTKQGHYEVGGDYPSVHTIQTEAKLSSTREKVTRAFNERAYPANYKTLRELVAKRNELAQLLGFASYAEYDLAAEMAGTPQRAWQFLDSLDAAVKDKVQEELKALTTHRPAEVPLDEKGRFAIWDYDYLMAAYKRQHLAVDEAKVAEYFPMDQTITGLLNLYARVFSVQFRELPGELWHPSVRRIAVEQGSRHLGTVLLDLHPRPGKYTHARVLALKPSGGHPQESDYQPGTVAVIANFTAPTKEKTALFTMREVTTFFHEFGHALHAIFINSRLSFLGTSELAMTYGLPVKIDFVELPSQMFEYWLSDEGVLGDLSSHYQSGKKMPATTVRAIINAQRFGLGLSANLHVMRARFALALYDGRALAADQAIQDLYRTYLNSAPYDVFSGAEEMHFPARFLHLNSYGAKYYSYQWAQVFAADIFKAFKGDVLNAETGERFCRQILRPGGSMDPNALLHGFLGRAPNAEALKQSFAK